MESPDLNDIFMRYLDKDCSPEEAAWLLEQLAKSDVTPPLRELLEQQLTDWSRKQNGDKEDTATRQKLAAIKKMVDQELAPHSSIRLSWNPWAAAAALAGILVGVYILLKPATVHQAAVTYTAQAGERRSMRLPDGSQVILNGDSHVTLAEGFSNGNRDVTLSGEAYFDVSQNAKQPFVIHTALMDIKVLGTAFNVRSYPDEASDETSLIRGKVSITLKRNGKHIDYILNPMQKLVVAKDTATTVLQAKATTHIDTLRKSSVINNLAETAWTENKLAFDNETLGIVAQKMAKWYGVNIQFETPSLKEIPYTGSFDGETLETVIETIQYSIPMLHYRMERNKKLVLY